MRKTFLQPNRTWFELAKMKCLCCLSRNKIRNWSFLGSECEACSLAVYTVHVWTSVNVHLGIFIMPKEAKKAIYHLRQYWLAWGTKLTCKRQWYKFKRLCGAAAMTFLHQYKWILRHCTEGAFSLKWYIFWVEWTIHHQWFGRNAKGKILSLVTKGRLFHGRVHWSCVWALCINSNKNVSYYLWRNGKFFSWK